MQKHTLQIKQMHTQIQETLHEFFLDLNVNVRKGCEKAYVTFNFGLTAAKTADGSVESCYMHTYRVMHTEIRWCFLNDLLICLISNRLCL